MQSFQIIVGLKRIKLENMCTIWTTISRLKVFFVLFNQASKEQVVCGKVQKTGKMKKKPPGGRANLQVSQVNSITNHNFNHFLSIFNFHF